MSDSGIRYDGLTVPPPTLTVDNPWARRPRPGR